MATPAERFRTGNYELGTRLVGVYRALDRIRVAKGEVGHIDFDLAPVRYVTLPDGVIKTEEQAEGLLAHYALQADPRTPDGAFMRASVKATLAFLRVARGEPVGYAEYIRETLETHPNQPFRRRIEDKYNLVADLARECGFTYDPDGWSRYLQDAAVRPDTVKLEFRKARQRVIPVLLEELGLDFNPQYRTEVKPVDEPWMFWTKVDRRAGVVLTVNTHSRHESQLYQAKFPPLLAHELGAHGFQGLQIREGVDKGGLNPFYAISKVPGPEQFGNEGLAIVMCNLLPAVYEALGPEGRMEAERYKLATWAYQVVANEAAQAGEVKPEHWQFIQHFVPSEQQDRFERQMRERLEDPVYRSYHPAYSLGSLLLDIAAEVLPIPARKELVQALLETYLTPTQIRRKIEELKSKYIPHGDQEQVVHEISELDEGQPGFDLRNWLAGLLRGKFSVFSRSSIAH
ncbi:hypothetical protein HYW42_02500 [Candidatus Daviesbacteria bacterium]|nr:hypothetical protein [Candidatus Daviesbacteria bacterium]